MTEDDLRPEYDFTELGKAVRGKHVETYRQGSNVVVLDEDVANVFPNGKAVNNALRLLIDLAKKVDSMGPRS